MTVRPTLIPVLCVLHNGGMVSLGELSLASSAALRPLAPFDAARRITGVHVSELADPGRCHVGGHQVISQPNIMAWSSWARLWQCAT